MGYTHYWYRKEELSESLFFPAALDCAAVAKALKIPLAGGMGRGHPAFDFELVCFNGVKECGHPPHDLGIAWPHEEAEGVASYDEPVDIDTWFAGAKLLKRACGGDCSHETFFLPRVFPKEEDDPVYEGGMYFGFCKTAFKPYDLTVQCCLVVFSHYFGNEFTVQSNGQTRLWNEPRRICQKTLGYGQGFQLSEPPEPI